LAKKTSKPPAFEDEIRADFPVPPATLDETGAHFISPSLSTGGPPEQKRLPSLADMKDLSMAELQGIMDHYGVGTPWETLRGQTSDYVARMTELKSGTRAFEREVNKLFDINNPNGTIARRAALGMARRVDQTWSMLDAAGGDMQANFTWLTEFDDAVCPGCEDNGGVTQSMAAWIAEGLPGPSTCYGGSYCRCDLIRTE